MKHTRKANKKKSTRRKKNLVKKHTRKHKRSYRRKVQRGGDPTIDEAIEQLQTWTSHLDENKKQIDEFTRIDLELAAKLAKFEKSLETLLNLKKISEDFYSKAKAKKETLEKEIEIHNGLIASYNTRKNSETDEKKVNNLDSLINKAQETTQILTDELNKLKKIVADNNNNLNNPKDGTLARLVFVNKSVDEIQKKMKEGDDETMRLIKENLKLDTQIDYFLTDNILLVGRYLFDMPENEISTSLQQILKKYFESKLVFYTKLKTLYKKLVKDKKDEDRRATLATQREQTELDKAAFAEQMKQTELEKAAFAEQMKQTELEKAQKAELKKATEQQAELDNDTFPEETLMNQYVNTNPNLKGMGFVRRKKKRSTRKGTLPQPPQLSSDSNTMLETDFPPSLPSSKSTVPQLTEVNVEKSKLLKDAIGVQFPILGATDAPVEDERETENPSLENPVYTQIVEITPEEASATIVVEVPVVEEFVNSNEEHEFHYTTQGQMPLIFTIRQEAYTDLDGINMELLNLFFTTTSIPGFMIPNIINSGGEILGMIDKLYPRRDNTTYLNCFNQNERLFSKFPCFTDFFYIYMFELLGTYFRWFPYYIRDPNILVNLVFRIITFVFPLKDAMVYTRYFTNELFKMISMYNSQQHIFLSKTYYDFELYLPDKYGNYYKPYEYEYYLPDGNGGMYKPYPL